MPSFIDAFREIFAGPPSVDSPDIACSVLRAAAELLSADSRESIAHRVCEALVKELPAIELAWVWYGDVETEHVRPVAWAGRASAYAAELDIPSTPLTRLGPVFRTIKGESVHAYRVSPESYYRPWRRLATEFGIQSVNVVPLGKGQASERGLLALYASDADFFSTRNQQLFLEFGQLLGIVAFQLHRRAVLVQESERDPLTGMLNRRGLLRAVSQIDPTRPVSLLVVDVDHFKQINNQLGYVTADRLLVSIASRLKASVRESDSIARLGGDEFIALVTGGIEPAGIEAAQRILAAMQGIEMDGFQITVSIGLTHFEQEASLETNLARADTALRAAKIGGRNGFRVA